MASELSTQLLRIIDYISLNLNLRKKTAAILFDVEKAFDKV